MPKYAHPDVLDQGPALIRSAGTRLLLLSAYAFGDSFATATSNTVATANLATADFALASSGNNRVLTLAAGKTATASAAAPAIAGVPGTPDLHIAVTDGASRVLWVTDETRNDPVVVGAAVTWPALTYTALQPV